MELVGRALAEADGRMTVSLLMKWGMSEPAARELSSRYESKGWLFKDSARANARFVTDELRAIWEKFAPNHQTGQTLQTTVDEFQTAHQTGLESLQTDSKPVQTALDGQ